MSQKYLKMMQDLEEVNTPGTNNLLDGGYSQEQQDRLNALMRQNPHALDVGASRPYDNEQDGVKDFENHDTKALYEYLLRNDKKPEPAPEESSEPKVPTSHLDQSKRAQPVTKSGAMDPSLEKAFQGSVASQSANNTPQSGESVFAETPAQQQYIANMVKKDPQYLTRGTEPPSDTSQSIVNGALTPPPSPAPILNQPRPALPPSIAPRAGAYTPPTLPSAAGYGRDSKPDEYHPPALDIPHPQANVQRGTDPLERDFQQAVNQQDGQYLPTGPQGIAEMAKQMRDNRLSKMAVKDRSGTSGTDPQLIQYLLKKYQHDSIQNEAEQDALAESTKWNGIARGLSRFGAGIAQATPNTEMFDQNIKNAQDRSLITTKQNKQSADVLESAAKLSQIKKMHDQDISLADRVNKTTAGKNDVERLSKRLESSGLSALDPAIEKLKKLIDLDGTDDISGFGLTGSVPEAALTQQGKENRQIVQEFRNIILRARSGGAVTPGEADRLEGELGTGITRGDPQLRTGLKNVITSLSGAKQGIIAGYDPSVAQQFRSQGGNTNIPAKDFSGGWSDKKEQRFNEFDKKYGGGN